LGLSGAAQTGAAAVLAIPVFLVGSLGFRLVGLPSLWRCLRHPSQHDPIWRLMAWTVIAAFLAATFVVSVPYHETTQIYQFALFLLIVFAGQSLGSLRKPRARFWAPPFGIALGGPSTLQYLHRKWNDRNHPLAEASQGERTLAAYLGGTDPERTVILHDHPIDPALLGILSERRSVLSWAGYVRGNEPRRADVEAFFAAADSKRSLEILRSLRPTHIVEY